MKRSDGRVVACAIAIALVLTSSACAAAKKTAAGDFEPAAAGRLTVATDLPAPAFWTGDDPKRVDGGFEWGIAHDLADQFDLDLTIVDVPFRDIIAGELHGADLALAQVSITKEREQAVDFSTPYFTSQPTVVARKGKDLTDLATAREWTWSARESTTEADFIDDVIRPDDGPAHPHRAGGTGCVRAGRVDAALLDLPTALILTKGTQRPGSDLTFRPDRGLWHRPAQRVRQRRGREQAARVDAIGRHHPRPRRHLARTGVRQETRATCR